LTETDGALFFSSAPISRRQLRTDWLEGGTSRPRAGRLESLPPLHSVGRVTAAGQAVGGGSSRVRCCHPGRHRPKRPAVLFGHAPAAPPSRLLARSLRRTSSRPPPLPTVAARRARGVPLVPSPPPLPSVGRPHRRAPRPPTRFRAARRPAWPGARPSTAGPRESLTDRPGRSVLPSTSPLGGRDAACTSSAVDGRSPTRWTDVGALFVGAARRHPFPRSVELAPLAACDCSRHCRRSAL